MDTTVHSDHLTDPRMCQWRDGHMLPEEPTRTQMRTHMHTLCICIASYIEREAKHTQTQTVRTNAHRASNFIYPMKTKSLIFTRLSGISMTEFTGGACIFCVFIHIYIWDCCECSESKIFSLFYSLTKFS